jgi:hypothetical protein
VSLSLRLLAIFRKLAVFILDPVDVERVGEPALADAEFELRHGRAHAYRTGLLGALAAICVAFVSRRVRVLGERTWPGLVPVVTATCVGAFGLTRSNRSELASVHLLFLAFGAWVAAGLGTCRGASIRRAATPLGAFSAALLIATALLGDEADGAARWVTVGPLSIHVAVLVWPWVIAGMAEAFSRGWIRTALGIGVAAQIGLVMQRDPSTLMVFTLAMLATAFATRRTRELGALAGSGLLASSAVWLARVELESVPYVDAAWELGHALGPFAWMLGILASLCAATAPLRALRKATDPHAQAFGLGAATALGGFCLRPLVRQHDAVFFLGHGGSPIVGALIACAIVSVWMPQRSNVSPASHADERA